MNTIRHLDLFSGIGGFALAARMVGGIETVGFCEIDPYATKVLQKNFPDIPIHNDVKTLDPSNYGRIDLITGGYPCQPFSHAGRRAGEKDDRHLWPEVRRIIKEARPRWVLCENVVGHLTMGLDAVLSDMERIGYTGEAIIIPACAVDAKHRRDRIWIIGHSDSDSKSTRSIYDEAPWVLGVVADTTGEGLERYREPQKTSGALRKGCHTSAGGMQEDASSHSCNDGGREQTGIKLEGKKQPVSRDDSCIAANSSGQRQPRPWESFDSLHQEKEGEGEADYAQSVSQRGIWQPEPGMGRVANGVPCRMDRLKGLGNAIVPQVAAEILRCMMRVDSMINPLPPAPKGD